MTRFLFFACLDPWNVKFFLAHLVLRSFYVVNLHKKSLSKLFISKDNICFFLTAL